MSRTRVNVFPTDSLTLAAVEHALGVTYDVDADGRVTLSAGFDFDLTHLLGIYSDKVRYSLEDVCLSLIAEIRRLRASDDISGEL